MIADKENFKRQINGCKKRELTVFEAVMSSFWEWIWKKFSEEWLGMSGSWW